MAVTRLFGTDGVRGRVGESPMVPEAVTHLGYAAGRVLMQGRALAGERPQVLVGRDTRVSGPLLELALGAGLCAAGADVVFAGTLPTPAVAYLTRCQGLQAGAVISASHNPYEDNGIKFFSADGLKLSDALEDAIEAEMATACGCVASADLGRATHLPDAGRRYVEFCRSRFPQGQGLRGMKIVVDGAHGAAYQVAPQVFSDLGAEVVAVACSPDGLNINDGVGATAPAHLAHAVRQHGADLGIALDGDGDRLLMADGDGTTYNGDQLLYLIARFLQQHGGMVGGVVGTLMSNQGLESALRSLGVPFVRANVGDRHVLEVLLQRQWRLGGETSGHIICLDQHTTGDAIIAALQVLGALRQSGRSLAQLTRQLVLYAQRIINVRVGRGVDWQANAVIAQARADVERTLGRDGRVLLRASGTEPVLRVMVEARSEAQSDALARALADVAAAELA